MKITCLDQPVLDHLDQPIEDVTVKSAVAMALLTDLAEDATDAKGKDARYSLWLKLRSGETDFSVGDIALMKTRVGLVCSTLVQGQIKALLDPPATAPAGKPGTRTRP